MKNFLICVSMAVLTLAISLVGNNAKANDSNFLQRLQNRRLDNQFDRLQRQQNKLNHQLRNVRQRQINDVHRGQLLRLNQQNHLHRGHHLNSTLAAIRNQQHFNDFNRVRALNFGAPYQAYYDPRSQFLLQPGYGGQCNANSALHYQYQQPLLQFSSGGHCR